MKLHKLTTVLAGSALLAAACDRGPTGPDSMQADINAVDPVVVTFAATQGLPGGPIGDMGHGPFMGGMPFMGAPASAADGRGPGAAFPDSLKLTDAQKAAIQALVAAFTVANATDLAAMKAAHVQARDAHKAGASREAIRAILDAVKPSAERVRTAAEALHTAIGNVLTAAQKAWLEAHKPAHPPRTP